MTAWTKERDAQIEKMRELGLTFSQIAAAFGMTSSAVIGRADRLGLAKQGQPATRSHPKRKPRIVNHGNYFKVATAVPPPVPAIDQRSDAPVALLDLEPHHCRWPVRDAPYAFCGSQKMDGSSYCDPHRLASKRGVADRS